MIYSAIVTLLTNKPLDRRVHFHIDENSMTTKPVSSNATKPNKGLFSVSQIGDIMLRKPLDYEQHSQYSLLVRIGMILNNTSKTRIIIGGDGNQTW